VTAIGAACHPRLRQRGFHPTSIVGVFGSAAAAGKHVVLVDMYGAFVANGNRCHLFYVGDEHPFKNFHLKVDVMTEPGSNGGIYFHTKYQPSGWPKAGFETQVNNTHSDWKKTGSVYDVANDWVATLEAREPHPTRDLHVRADHHGNRSPRADPLARGTMAGWIT
jgi:hypothetical protein